MQDHYVRGHPGDQGGSELENQDKRMPGGPMATGSRTSQHQEKVKGEQLRGPSSRSDSHLLGGRGWGGPLEEKKKTGWKDRGRNGNS